MPVQQKPDQQLAARRRMIRVACTQLGIDDEQRRQIMRDVAGVSSSTGLDLAAADKVIAHLKKAGFKMRPGTAKPAAKSSRPLADDAQSEKIRALWLTLHALGAVRNPSEAALAAYVKRVTGVDALQWLSSAQASTVIEAQKKWALRFLPAALESLQASFAAASIPLAARGKGIALCKVAASRGSYDALLAAWEYLSATIPPADQESSHGA